MNNCPRKEYFCYAIECDCPKDPDTDHELNKEAIHAEDNGKVYDCLHTPAKQGTLSIRLNGSDLATIDPNTGAITGLPAQLTFDQFEYINKIFTAIKP